MATGTYARNADYTTMFPRHTPIATFGGATPDPPDPIFAAILYLRDHENATATLAEINEKRRVFAEATKALAKQSQTQSMLDTYHVGFKVDRGAMRDDGCLLYTSDAADDNRVV